jgi:mRNA interferase RelE/StbE
MPKRMNTVRTLKLTAAARRDMKSVAPELHATIRMAVSELAADPHPPGSIQLRNSRDWRLRIDPYRIIYKITPSTVVVVRVEKRSGKTYRGYNPEDATPTHIRRSGGPICN